MTTTVFRYVSSGGCELCDSRDGEIVDPDDFTKSHPNCECELEEEDSEMTNDDVTTQIADLITEIDELEEEYEEAFDYAAELNEVLTEKRDELEELQSEWSGKIIEIE